MMKGIVYLLRKDEKTVAYIAERENDNLSNNNKLLYKIQHRLRFKAAIFGFLAVQIYNKEMNFDNAINAGWKLTKIQ